jgi:hypothetical protein
MFTNVFVAVTLNDISGFLSPSQNSQTANNLALPKAFDKMWTYALNGNMYKLAAGIGMLVAVFGVGYWSVKFYKTLQESTLLPVVNDLIYPLVIVVLLANGGSNLRSLTLASRDVMNNINTSIYRVVDLDIDYQSALKVLLVSNEQRAVMDYLTNTCSANINQSVLADCIARMRTLDNFLLTGSASSFGNSSNPDVQRQIQEFRTYNAELQRKAGENLSKVNRPGKIADSVNQPPVIGSNNEVNVFSINSSNYTDAQTYFAPMILSIGKSFLYLIEVMMMVEALFGPIFVGLSMFPVGTKPLLTWGIFFLATGFCKICYSLITGLVAVAMVLAGPQSADMMILSIVLGVLSPILSVTIASLLSSSLSSAASQIAYAGQSYGLKAGLTSGPPPGLPQSFNSNGNNVGGGGK